MARFEQYVDFQGHKYHGGSRKRAGGLEEIQPAFGLLHLHHDQPNVPCGICGRPHLNGSGIEYDQSSDDEHQVSHAKEFDCSSSTEEVFDRPSKEENSEDSEDSEDTDSSIDEGRKPVVLSASQCFPCSVLQRIIRCVVQLGEDRLARNVSDGSEEDPRTGDPWKGSVEAAFLEAAYATVCVQWRVALMLDANTTWSLHGNAARFGNVAKPPLHLILRSDRWDRNDVDEERIIQFPLQSLCLQMQRKTPLFSKKLQVVCMDEERCAPDQTGLNCHVKINYCLARILPSR